MRGFWKIGPKICVVVALPSLIAIALAAVAISGFRGYDRAFNQMTIALESGVAREQLIGTLAEIRAEGRGLLVADDADASKESSAAMEADLDQVRPILEQYQALLPSEDRPPLLRIDAAIDGWLAAYRSAIGLAQTGDVKAVRAAIESAQQRRVDAELAADFRTLAGSNDAEIDGLKAEIASYYDARFWTLVVLALGGIVLSVAFAIAIAVYGISQPIRRLTEMMTVVGRGDTEVRIPGTDREDEIGGMARAVTAFLDRTLGMRKLVESIMENVRGIAVAAGQASNAVGQVSDGSKIQLDRLEQSSGALQQSSGAIGDVARSTQHASQRSRELATLVESGIRKMDDMVTLAGTMAESSQQISRVADSISRIATQTNMLSLNASIEAARAGEHGKGFAVVAEEVGKLAENSRSLAENIAEQMKEATGQAESGVRMAQEVSANMRAIAAGVTETDKLSGSIATAIEEQRAIVAEINNGVIELTRIGQSNAAAAQEIATTMLDLSKLAERTRGELDAFND